MKIKSFVITIALTIAVLGFGFGTNAQTTDTQALIAQLQAQILSLMQQIATLIAQQNGTQAWCHNFNTNLGYANSGSIEVGYLHTALQKQDFSFAPDTGNTFADGTASAVVGFQEKYSSDVLGPYGLAHGTGFVGTTTRKKLNVLYGCNTTPTPPPTQPSITLDQLKNIYVDYAYGGQLNSGQYLSSVIQCTASTCMNGFKLYLGLDTTTAKFGDFNNDGTQDAVVGIRYGYVSANDDITTAPLDAKTEFLALAQMVNGQPKIIDKLYGPTDIFGFWERINSIAVNNGQLTVDVTELVNYSDATGQHEIRRIYQINIVNNKFQIISVSQYSVG